jgi:hypothetical protein
MTGHGERMSRLKEKAILALLSSRTCGTAAYRTGVCESTLRRWLADPGFAREYQEAKDRLLVLGLMQLVNAALDRRPPGGELAGLV